MTVETSVGISIKAKVLHNYFGNLVNRFFKILPMREKNEESLSVYMQSLRAELLGCKELICTMKDDSLFLTLISILQYLIDHPECEVKEVKREVFHAISICSKFELRYADERGD